jgi:hypothetical protein
MLVISHITRDDYYFGALQSPFQQTRTNRHLIDMLPLYSFLVESSTFQTSAIAMENNLVQTGRVSMRESDFN